MKKGIEITRALAGYTRISYNGVEIAKHHLSPTIQGTREAFEIPEEQGVISWIEKKYAKEIKAIVDIKMYIKITKGTYNTSDYRVVKEYYSEKAALKFLKTIGYAYNELSYDTWNYFGTKYTLSIYY